MGKKRHEQRGNMKISMAGKRGSQYQSNGVWRHRRAMVAISESGDNENRIRSGQRRRKNGNNGVWRHGSRLFSKMKTRKLIGKCGGRQGIRSAGGGISMSNGSSAESQ